MLKVGTLCWIKMAEDFCSEAIGKVAEVMGPEQGHRKSRHLVYPIKVDGVGGWWAPGYCLIPFSDPDQTRPEYEPKPIAIPEKQE